MAEKKISYLSKNFEDLKSELIGYTQTYYPEIAGDLDDASVGTWLIELAAAVGDNLSYYIDKAYNETNIESAQLKSSVYSIARNNGFKIPGPKGSITELKFTCELPPSVGDSPNDSSTLGMPSWTYAPIIRKGTRVSTSSGQYFETTEDIDFTEQFDSNGVSNREITPLVDANNKVRLYRVSKTCTAVAGITRIYKLVLTSSMIKPFMEVIIPDKNVMNVDSIILKDGTNFQGDPCNADFMLQSEFLTAKDSGDVDIYRFFEANSLLDMYRWGDDVEFVESTNKAYLEPKPKIYTFSSYVSGTTGEVVPVMAVAKGAWKPLTQKFITEYTDKGYLKVIFGGGEQAGQAIDVNEAGETAKNQIASMVYNNSLGKTPKAGTTMFIRYRIGGGAASNVAKDTITTITYLDAVNKTTPVAADQNIASAIITSINVTNTIPSVSGKDAPTVDEIKAMVKYNNAAQNRCITVKDYEDRVLKLPARYGCPFRVGTIEENNKIMIYLLMTNYLGQLSDTIPSVLIENIENYLSMYRSLNDYVEIKSGRIINISVEIDAYIDKNYNAADVVNDMISTIKDYMDINNHVLGEDIYVSDMEKEVSKVDGVLNIIDTRIYNEFDGSRYSSTQISQQTVNVDENGNLLLANELATSSQVDLEASDYILNSEADEMFEIKYPDTDIRIRVKSR